MAAVQSSAKKPHRSLLETEQTLSRQEHLMD